MIAINNFYPFKDKVSIIIPVYNGSNFLEQAIDSALNQTHTNKEIIVVNDGSNDGGYVEKIALSYNNKIKYFFKKRGGVSSALNFGIERMKGDYFAWLSHDDIFEKDKIEKQLNFLKRKNLEACYTKVRIINKQGKVIGKDRSNWYPRKNAIKEILKKTYINGSSILLSKNCLIKTGLFNEKLLYTQDNEMWLRILENYEIGLVDSYLVQYRSHKDQGTMRDGKIITKEAQIMYKEIFEKIVLKSLLIKSHDHLKEKAKLYIWFGDIMAINRAWYDFAESYYMKSLKIWNSPYNFAKIRIFFGIGKILIPLRIVKKFSHILTLINTKL
tara:strand:- start:25172 stop:26155 length:984 start_codon:yes stop_codon:yes gene_type:complete